MGLCLQPPCIITEFCARGSLFDVLRKARTSQGFAQQLDWSKRLSMALDAAKVLLLPPALCCSDLHSFCIVLCGKAPPPMGTLRSMQLFDITEYSSRDNRVVTKALALALKQRRHSATQTSMPLMHCAEGIRTSRRRVCW